MSISTRSLPPGVTFTVWAEPVLGQLGIESLAPRIASVFARWSVLEKQLNQLFTLVTDAEGSARAHYDALKGWDRRADDIETHARARLDADLADLVCAVLRLVKTPAAKRDALAHRVWAVAEGLETELVLLPPDDQHAIAENVIAVRNAGRCDIQIDNSRIQEAAVLVSAADLDAVIAELTLAGERMNDLLIGHFYPPFADTTEQAFADYRERLTRDAEVTERLASIANGRRQAARAMRRAKSARPPS